jgi:hypothetical protein
MAWDNWKSILDRGVAMTNESSTKRVPSVGCGFWLLWILGTVTGTGVGWLVGWWVSFRVPGQLATLILGLVVGLFLGALQWLVLRGVLPGAGWWIPASTVGWGTGFYLGAVVSHLVNLTDFSFGLALGAVVGLLSGVFQWLVLRRRTRHAGWWILASIFSWTFALLFYQAGLSAIGLYFGLMVGMVTGWALIGILSFA